VRSRSLAAEGARETPVRPTSAVPIARRDAPQVRSGLEAFLARAGGQVAPAVDCDPGAEALAAEIQRARLELERVLPTDLLFAAGTVDARVTRVFQATIDRIVEARAGTVTGHTFDCTARACRLSLLMEGQDQGLLNDLRRRLAHTHANLPMIMVSTASNIVERPGELPLTQTDTFFKVMPLDQLTGQEAEDAQSFIREVLTPSPGVGEQGR
jgi:hypothetical protein